MATTLVVNPGSSSRKYALYRSGQAVLEFRFEDTNSGFEMCSQTMGTQQICEAIKKNDFTESFERVAEAVDAYLFREERGKKLDSVVIRVVAPGTFFQKHAIIDDAYVTELTKKAPMAPLHIPIILREVAFARKHYKQTKIIAASDSAFHSDLPPKAREYSIAVEDSNQLDIHRFGYHGLSVASIVRRIHPLIGQQPERLIVCHIGSGTSVSAVKNGKSVETTMGFAPATGLPMGSRAGEIDSAALLELMRVKHWRPADAEMYLNTSGGLAGIAKEADVRRLLDRRAQNDPVATHALDVFAYNIQKAIAAQTVALGGLDVIVLTATAAVRSSELRSLILGDLAHLGVQVSKDRNDLLVGKDGVISVRNSAVKVVVMRTDEMGEMAQVAERMSLGEV
ncbi:MAG: acetate/propionate family kinase [Candidatus Pacebacteria bacterium]|jgi:acetate kinase|nr:acetate/propionate family kinase [Candidatus Paceibacterota bacterium]